MTHRILKSEFAPPPVSFDHAKQAFDKLVDTFIHELQTWHEHDIQVKALRPIRPQPQPYDHAEAEDPATAFWKDIAAWQAEKLACHEPYPKPIAHPDIVAAVATNIGADGNITYVPDFEIVNDDPTPEQILREKKDALLGKIYHAEEAAKNLALPPIGKRRLMNLRENDIVLADSKFAKDLIDSTPDPDRARIDIAKELKKSRDPKHTHHLEAQESIRAKVDRIVRAGAQAMSDVEDLTLDNIDNYQIPTFARIGGITNNLS
jgi:hypothetical protein